MREVASEEKGRNPLGTQVFRRSIRVLVPSFAIRQRSIRNPFANRSLPPNSVSKISREPLADPLAQLELDFLAQAFGDGASLKSLLIEREKTLGIGPENALAGQIESAFAHARTMVESPVCPIVAVLGMLNAGKSSLVATFLSPPKSASAGRVLIGSANTEGTHRFVLWLPESWRSNSVIWGFLSNRLTQVFGCAPEELAASAEQAARQYNDQSMREVFDVSGKQVRRSALEVPLVASDPQLDRLGIALMDCPDVQTGLMSGWHSEPDLVRTTRLDELSMAASEARFAVLERSALVCSAYIVVLPANAMHDQTVSRLLKMLEAKMPHVQRMLAVNRVPRKYESLEISHEMRTLYGFCNPSRIYMAYHFEGPQRREKLQCVPSEISDRNDTHLPAFYRIDQVPVPQPPAPVDDAAWMLRLGEQLQGNALLSDAIDSSLTNLKIAAERGLQTARDWISESNRRLASIHSIIAQACLDFSLDPSASASQPKIRLQASRQVVEQIAESLERTAPWWAKPGRWMQRLAQASKDSVGYATSWMKMPTWMIDRGNSVGQWARTRLQRGESGKVVTADVLVDALAKCDRRGILSLDDRGAQREHIREACQQAITRFQAESSTQLDPEQVDGLTKKLWEQMPMGKRIIRGVAPAGILFAPLLAVIMIPLDFGGSSVLVFASLKELLFASAAGFGLMLASGDGMPQLAESESAWQQLSDLVAVLTDQLGLARKPASDPTEVTLGSTTRKLAPSTIAPNRQPKLCLQGIPPSERSSNVPAWDSMASRLERLRQTHQQTTTGPAGKTGPGEVH